MASENKTKTVLMCPPIFFDIEYEINPWMDLKNQVNPKQAAKQWKSIYDTYTQKLGWDVELIDPIKGLPDMVFTANGGLVLDGRVILPKFLPKVRQPETPHFKTWFESAGYPHIYMPKYVFEGQGDALVWNDVIFAGYGIRTDMRSHKEIANFSGKKVVSLELVDSRFFHLDTALTVLNSETVAFYPKAFSKQSQKNHT